MLIYTYPLSALWMLIFPIILGLILAKTYRLSWQLFLYGGAAFILAQLFHLPLNAILTRIVPGLGGSDGHVLFQAAVFAFTAAITEELARYSILRNKLKNARSWKSALMYGAGHGGFESMTIGILAGLTFINMLAIQNNPGQLSGLEPDKLAMVQQQLTAYWSATWYESLMGAVERVSAIVIQISLAVIVMQVFLRDNKSWLWAAIGWHWLVNAVSVWSLSQFDIVITELIIGVFALTSLMIILYFRPVTEDEDQPPAHDLTREEQLPVDALEFSPPTDKLDRSRYTRP